MKNIMTYILGGILIFVLSGCSNLLDDDFTFFDCTNPKTSTLSGIVLDNYTSLPVANTNITFSNFSLSAEESRMTITSDSRGSFSFTDTGCSFTDDLFSIRSITHEDYQGAAATSSRGNVKILVYKRLRFNLIFDHANYQPGDEISYRYSYCVYPNSTCHSSGDYGSFISSGKDTLKVKVAEGEPLKLRYNLNNNPRTYIDISTEGQDEFVITL